MSSAQQQQAMHNFSSVNSNSSGRHRRNRAHFQSAVDDNSHLSVNRGWNHLLPAAMNAAGETRPMAVVDGIGRHEDGGHRTKHGTGGGDNEEEELTFVRAMAIPHCRHTDWDALRQFRLQEMNEIRQRAAHMENTMRWWLISAEQWRDKWAAVRGERNRLREENGRLRTALATANAECRALKDGRRMEEEGEKKKSTASANGGEMLREEEEERKKPSSRGGGMLERSATF